MAESKQTIKKVEGGKEKGISFSENFKHYNKAKESGFYFECLWILYAMLEDRVSAFLYYLGFTKTDNADQATDCEKIRLQIRQMLNLAENKKKFSIGTLNQKLSKIVDVFAWCDSIEPNADYQKAVKKAIQRVSKNQDFLDALKYMKDEWCDKRNQLVHALFNKDPQAVILELQPLVEQGYMAVRKMDNAVKQLKRSKIRERFNIV